MQTKIMEFKSIKHFKVIGEVFESKVYGDGEYALKIYNRYRMKIEHFQNKMYKIFLLSELNMDNFLLPKELIFTNGQKFIGYSMKRILTNLDLYDFMKSDKNTLDKKIEMLKKLEKNVKLAHKNDIVLVDCNFWNFLISENNLFMIDTDSYKVKGFKEDFLPPFYYGYYSEKINDKVDSNLDKFQIGVNILRFLTRESFDEKILLHYENDFLERYIKNLDISNETKDFFYELVSSSKEKLYIENNLDSLSSNKCFIKKH